MKEKIKKVIRVVTIVLAATLVVSLIMVGIIAGVKAISAPCWPCTEASGGGGQVTPNPTPNNGAQLPTRAEMNSFLSGVWYPGICSNDIENRIKLAFPNSQPTWETKDGALLLYVTVKEGKFQVAWHQEGERQVGSLVVP